MTNPLATWVCDSCMATVERQDIADMVDGEHVICKRCDHQMPQHAKGTNQ
jgi:hypothetical protein